MELVIDTEDSLVVTSTDFGTGFLCQCKIGLVVDYVHTLKSSVVDADF